MRKCHNASWVDPRSFGCVADDPRAFLAKRHDVGIGWYAGELLGETGFHVLPRDQSPIN
jgi:hypothetical protein